MGNYVTQHPSPLESYYDSIVYRWTTIELSEQGSTLGSLTWKPYTTKFNYLILLM
jgi:hypothetical protein